jgi:hypothetical protein
MHYSADIQVGHHCEEIDKSNKTHMSIVAFEL